MSVRALNGGSMGLCIFMLANSGRNGRPVRDGKHEHH
jgi:hypothetical protein